MPSALLTSRASTSLFLRPAATTEADELAELRVKAMRPSLEAAGRFDPIRAKQRFLSSFSAVDTRVIEQDGQIVGLVVVRQGQDELSLDHLYISPEYQGMGVGSQVLRQVFEEADAQQKPVRVGALKGSRSNDFFVRHGFQLVRRKHPAKSS